MKCTICGKRIETEQSGWSEGHNAQPVNDGRCCGPCNVLVVIPRRITDMVDAEYLAEGEEVRHD